MPHFQQLPHLRFTIHLSSSSSTQAHSLRLYHPLTIDGVLCYVEARAVHEVNDRYKPATMLVDVAAQTKAALEANRTLRCLAEIKYRKESRRSPIVISWGEVGARAFCRNLLEATDLEMEHEMQILMVSMSVRHKVQLCFDIFLSDCSGQTKSRIQQSTNEPIHFLFAKNKTYYIRRHRGMDTIVSSYYAHAQKWDKGPLPYFTDHYNPPIYCDGKRMEHGVTYFGEPIKLYVPGDSDTEEEEGDETTRDSDSLNDAIELRGGHDAEEKEHGHTNVAPGSAAGRPGEDNKANLHGKARDAGQRKQKDEEEESAVPEPRFAPAVMALVSQQVSGFERLAIKTASPSILDEPRTPAEDTFSVPDTTAGFSFPGAATTDSVASDAIASERASADN